MGKISLKDFDSIEDDTAVLAMDLDVIQLQREVNTVVASMENLHKEIESMKQSMAQMVTREEIQANSFKSMAGQILLNKLTKPCIFTISAEHPARFMGATSWALFTGSCAVAFVYFLTNF